MENKEFEYLKKYISENHVEQKIYKDKSTREVYCEVFYVKDEQNNDDRIFDKLDVYLIERNHDGYGMFYSIGYDIKYLDENEDLIEISRSEDFKSFKSIEKFFDDMKRTLSEEIRITVDKFEYHDKHTARVLSFIEETEKNLLKYKLEDQLTTKSLNKKSMKI